MSTNAIARKLEVIEQKSGMRSADVATLLGTRPETVSRWNTGRNVPHRETERRLLELEYIVNQLSDLYEPEDARLWLFSRQKLLGGETPADLIKRGEMAKVLDLIGKLVEGVYA